MARQLPYFQFEPGQWENGNIQMCSFEDKGLFIDLCSIYWQRLGVLPFKLAVQKLCGGNATAFDSLIDCSIFEVSEGFVRIEFLDEQLNNFENESARNSKNARDGWEKRRKQRKVSDRNATASKSQCESDAIREEKRREENKREESRAIDFLKNEHPSLYEQGFLMKYAKQIQNLPKFLMDFNDTVDQESLNYDHKVLMARIGKYARNWIENQNKQHNGRPAQTEKKYDLL